LIHSVKFSCDTRQIKFRNYIIKTCQDPHQRQFSLVTVQWYTLFSLHITKYCRVVCTHHKSKGSCYDVRL